MGDDRDLPLADTADEWEPRHDRRDWVPLSRMRTRHRNGVPWWQAPLPPRFHACRVQSIGLVFGMPDVLRCACGAIAYAQSGITTWLDFEWTEKNSRRRSVYDENGELIQSGDSVINVIRNFFRSLGDDS